MLCFCTKVAETFQFLKQYLMMNRPKKIFHRQRKFRTAFLQAQEIAQASALYRKLFSSGAKKKAKKRNEKL